jgi:hypothetical protein
MADAPHLKFSYPEYCYKKKVFLLEHPNTSLLFCAGTYTEHKSNTAVLL